MRRLAAASLVFCSTFMWHDVGAVPTLSLAPRVDYVTAANPQAAASGDMNADGFPDLVVPDYGANLVSVLLGDGLGAFGAKTDFTAGINPVSVALGRLNGDAHLDVMVSNWNGSSISVFLGDGTGSLGPRTDFPLGPGRPISGKLADVNGDGNLDAVVANWSGSGKVQVMLGDGLGGFSAAVNSTTLPYAYAVAVGHVNGDGLIDVAVGYLNGANTSVSVMFGIGVGSFGGKVDFTAGTNPSHVALADVNGDGLLDLMAANLDSDDVSVLMANGLGGFSPSTGYLVGDAPTSIATSDLNLDGDADLVVSNSGSASVSVLLGDGTGNFGPKADFTTGTGPTRMALGDLNGDNKPDLAVPNLGSSTVSILLNATVESPPAFVRAWGSRGTGDGQFISPVAMVADTAGNLLVLDVGNSSIQKFTRDGVFLWKVGSQGSGDGQFRFGVAGRQHSPRSNASGIMAMDSSGTIYVCDAGNDRIQRFSPAGVYLGQWGTPGVADGQFNEPVGVVIDDKNAGATDIYVLDRGNHRIQKFGDTGVFMTRWGGCGSADGEFNDPGTVVLGPPGAEGIYVLDTGNSRVQKFSTAGAFVTKWGTKGLGPGQFSDPRAMFTVYNYRDCPLCPPTIHVLDAGIGAVRRFTSDGVLVGQTSGNPSDGWPLNTVGDPIPGVDVSVGKKPGGFVVTNGGSGGMLKFTRDGAKLSQWGGPGSGNGQFDQPAGVVIDDANAGATNIYILDRGNHRIQQFVEVAQAVSAIDPGSAVRPSALQLSAWPNPSSGHTQIAFTLPAEGAVTIGVYDVIGRRLRQWEWASMPAGQHQVKWDGLAEDGRRVPPSVLFYRLEAGGRVLKHKIARVQ